MNNLLNLNNFTIPSNVLDCTQFIASLSKQEIVALCNEVSVYAHETFKHLNDNSDLEILETLNYNISKNIAIAMVYDSSVLGLLDLSVFKNNNYVTSNQTVVSNINNVNLVKVVKRHVSEEDLNDLLYLFAETRESDFHLVLPEFEDDYEVSTYKIVKVNFDADYVVTKFVKNFNSIDALKVNTTKLNELDRNTKSIANSLVTQINYNLYTAFILKILLSILKTAKKIDVLTSYEKYNKNLMSNIFISEYFELRKQIKSENKQTSKTNNNNKTKKQKVEETQEIKVVEEIQETQEVEVVEEIQEVEEDFQNEEDELKRIEAELEAKKQALQAKKQKQANAKKQKQTNKNTSNNNKKNTNKNSNKNNNSKSNNSTNNNNTKNSKVTKSSKPACANDADLPD